MPSREVAQRQTVETRNYNLKVKKLQNVNKEIRKILPWSLGQNFSDFFVHILGNAYFHSEISWLLFVSINEIKRNSFQGMKQRLYFDFRIATDFSIYGGIVKFHKRIENSLSTNLLLKQFKISFDLW